MSMKTNFAKDLRNGQEEEYNIYELFNAHPKVTIHKTPKEYQDKGDLYVQNFGFFIEVKRDMMAARTTNVCIEFGEYYTDENTSNKKETMELVGYLKHCAEERATVFVHKIEGYTDKPYLVYNAWEIAEYFANPPADAKVKMTDTWCGDSKGKKKLSFLLKGELNKQEASVGIRTDEDGLFRAVLLMAKRLKKDDTKTAKTKDEIKGLFVKSVKNLHNPEQLTCLKWTKYPVSIRDNNKKGVIK